MVRIKIEYFPPLSNVLQKREETFNVDLPGPLTLDMFLDIVIKEYAGKTGKFPLRLKEASQYVILLNGRAIPGHDTKLVDGDVLRIMLPLAGG